LADNAITNTRIGRKKSAPIRRHPDNGPPTANQRPFHTASALISARQHQAPPRFTVFQGRVIDNERPDTATAAIQERIQ
jgi:hypothetical protein